MFCRPCDLFSSLLTVQSSCYRSVAISENHTVRCMRFHLSVWSACMLHWILSRLHDSSAVSCNCYIVRIFHVSFHSQVAVLKIDGWLNPPDQGPEQGGKTLRYFALREGAIDSATRAVIWSGQSVQDLVSIHWCLMSCGFGLVVISQEPHQFGRCPFVCNVRGAASDYVGTALRCHSLRRLRWCDRSVTLLLL